MILQRQTYRNSSKKCAYYFIAFSLTPAFKFQTNQKHRNHRIRSSLHNSHLLFFLLKMARPKLIPILFIGYALFQSLVLQLNGLPINSSIKQRRAEKIASPSMIPSLVATQVYSSSMFEHWVPKKTGNKGKNRIIDLTPVL